MREPANSADHQDRHYQLLTPSPASLSNRLGWRFQRANIYTVMDSAQANARMFSVRNVVIFDQ
jgi:hypothetical protein